MRAYAHLSSISLAQLVLANYQLVFTDRPSHSNDYRIPYLLDGLAPFVFKVISPTGELRGWQRAGTLIQIFAYGGPGDTRGRSASTEV